MLLTNRHMLLTDKQMNVASYVRFRFCHVKAGMNATRQSQDQLQDRQHEHEASHTKRHTGRSQLGCSPELSFAP